MPSYVLAHIEVTDPVRYEDYKRLVADTLVPFGGRFVVRGATPQVLEGEWDPKRIVILEFPSTAAARDWWSSEAYRPARELRQATSTGTLVLLDGLPAGS